MEHYRTLRIVPAVYLQHCHSLLHQETGSGLVAIYEPDLMVYCRLQLGLWYLLTKEEITDTDANDDVITPALYALDNDYEPRSHFLLFIFVSF